MASSIKAIKCGRFDDLLYFKHLSNMRHDPKIRRLISKFGIEGYGWYCLILESISETITTQNPMPELEETSADLADFYNGNSAKIDEIVAYMVQSGLLEYNEITNQITCHKIYKLLEANQTRSEAIRQLISSYKTNKGLPDKTSETVTDKSERKEEKRREEEQEKNNSVTDKSDWVTPERVMAFIAAWDSSGCLPRDGRLLLNVSSHESAPAMDSMKRFTEKEVFLALENFITMRRDMNQYEPLKYGSPYSFLTTGISKHLPEALPFDTYRKRFYKTTKLEDLPLLPDDLKNGHAVTVPEDDSPWPTDDDYDPEMDERE